MVNSYTPLQVHTHLSFLQSLSKPKDLAKELANLSIGSCVISDYDIMGGCVQFYEGCKSNGIKPLLGTKIFVKNFGYATFIARNLDGWKELIKLSSTSYNKEHYCDIPSILIDEVAKLKNILVLVNNLFPITGLKSYLCENLIYQSSSKDDINNDVLCVASPKCLYTKKEDKEDNLLLLASKLSVTRNALQTAIIGTEFQEVYDKDFHLKSYDELLPIYGETLLKNTNIISDMCDDYSILSNPNLPKFNTPDGYTDSEYLRELCRNGWRKKISNRVDSSKINEYVDRIKYELDVINGAGLSPYFLIMQDIVNHMKDKGMLIGPGRGSAAGCLISHLINITNCDPLEYGLIFERFYNAGRNSPGKISLPDIDVDFPVKHRQYVIDYIRNTYGEKHVAQAITFSRMQGRGALKEVLRIHNVCNHYEADAISSNIPQEGAISDKLEEEEETSILRWTLNNEPKALEQWCVLKDGKYTGDYASYFEQAVRIEGTYKSYGKHASALIISGAELDSISPMIREKSGEELIVAFEYKDAEKCGCPKLDILGVNTLDRLMCINSLLRYGKLN